MIGLVTQDMVCGINNYVHLFLWVLHIEIKDAILAIGFIENKIIDWLEICTEVHIRIFHTMKTLMQYESVA